MFTSLFFKTGIFHAELGGRYNNDYKYGHNFTYTFNPSVFIAKQFKVFATLASAFKEPSLYQLYSQYANPSGSLKPETTTSYEAGFDWDILKSVSFNTVFYQRKTTDVVYFYTDPKTYQSYYANGDLENDKGLETELKLNFEKLNASMYYAYVIGTQTAANGAETNTLLRRPKNTFGVLATYQAYKSLLLGLNYKFVSNRSEVEYLNYAPYSTTISLPHYSLVDAHIQANASKKLSVYLDLQNLLNKKYVDWSGYNTAGFNTMAGIKYLIN